MNSGGWRPGALSAFWPRRLRSATKPATNLPSRSLHNLLFINAIGCHIRTPAVRTTNDFNKLGERGPPASRWPDVSISNDRPGSPCNGQGEAASVGPRVGRLIVAPSPIQRADGFSARRRSRTISSAPSTDRRVDRSEALAFPPGGAISWRHD